MRTNKAVKNTLRTFEGALAIPQTGITALRRMVANALLGEDQFYIDGVTIKQRIAELAALVPVDQVADLAIEVRESMNLRHVPLWLTLAVINRRLGPAFDTAALIERVCQRADEPAELLAMYWADGRKPIPAAMKRGLARAMLKFSSYGLAKYDRDGIVKLKDVVRVTHPKAANDDQASVLGQLLSGTLQAPDTWEVALSGGDDKREAFERLLREQKLGYMALLRNLRNMDQAGVDPDLVREAILARKGADRVLPFRYVAAARAAPRFEPWLDEALCAGIAQAPALTGETIVLVDVSGSMNDKLSHRSDLTRMDAAATLASIIHGRLRVFTFSQEVKEVAPRRGMAGVAAVIGSQPHMGTYLGKAVAQVSKLPHDRIIVLSDEQSHDAVPAPKVPLAYMINLASTERAVGHGPWTRISGFSENVLNWIQQVEGMAR